MSWKDDKDLGPWEFDEQPTKWGYLNNPRWSNNPKNSADSMSASEFCADRGISLNPEDTHVPCGHWHKEKTETEIEESATILTTDALWQQSLGVLKGSEIIGYGGMSDDSDTQYILGIINFDQELVAANLWNTTGSVSGLPGTSIVRSVKGVPTLFYYNQYENADGKDERHVFKLNENGVYSDSLVFVETSTLIEYTYSSSHWMAISTNGVIVVVNFMYAAGSPKVYGIYTRRSNDWGITWESVVNFNAIASYISIGCDSSGNFYIVAKDTNVSAVPFSMWQSTDGGASWNSISTVPTTPSIY